MRYVEHGKYVRLLVDPVPDAPLLPATRRVLASVFIAQRVTYTERILRERPEDELSDRRGDFLGQMLQLALGTRANLKVPAPASISHAAPGLRSR